jgi:hypothetical protein
MRGEFNQEDRMMKSFALGILIIALPCLSASATIINIPDDYPTIQEGIDACLDGDTVMVAGGIYSGPGNREISAAGKAITVMGGEGRLFKIVGTSKINLTYYDENLYLGQDY